MVLGNLSVRYQKCFPTDNNWFKLISFKMKVSMTASLSCFHNVNSVHLIDFLSIFFLPAMQPRLTHSVKVHKIQKIHTKLNNNKKMVSF